MKSNPSRNTPEKRSPAGRRRKSARGLVAVVVAAVVAIAAPYYFAATGDNGKAGITGQPKAAPTAGNAQSSGELSEQQAILQALNRLAYGPKLGEVERVQQMGLKKWIERQLHPESIDDSALDARLARFPTLKMSSAELLDQYPQPQVAARRAGMTFEQYREQQRARRRGLPQDDQSMSGTPPAPGPMEEGGMGPDPTMDGNAERRPGRNGVEGPMSGPEGDRTPRRIIAELSMAKVTRAVYSERQLYEQMVDFWYNHFNVFAAKGPDRWMVTSYERDAIRPHAMGKFRDLLGATAKSPAMLFFLDNWISADPVAWASLRKQQEQRAGRGRFGRGGVFGPRFPRGSGGQRPGPNQNPNDPNARPRQMPDRGLNENYGRELMELHTLGVGGGYTQQDVIEVAKAFTGWSIRQPRRTPEFFFDNRVHDNSVKTVLGHKIHAGGIKDGEQVLDLLARNPHTARHISFKIAQRFVSDGPPAALVERMTKTFLKTDGDIREVLRAMIDAPEFWSAGAYRAKIKTPFELVVSATRAAGAEVRAPMMLVQWTGRIGQPLYMSQPPTGYPDRAADWVNTGALLNRLNFSLALAGNRLRGVRVDVDALLGGEPEGDAHADLERMIGALLGSQASAQTREILEKQLNEPDALQAGGDDPARKIGAEALAGLVLGSPEFQRR